MPSAPPSRPAPQPPTLLVGLGGLGSQIVDAAYARVPPERRDRIAVHAFDTNVNDISKLRHLRGATTQTSDQWTVGQYLHHAGPEVRTWFPDDVRELLRKTLTEGAGQVRAVSRLAYRAALEQGRLRDIERQISGLFRARGEEAMQSLRVMIVSSLAGGTGAGLFLQVALYLRDHLQRRGVESVLVRGLFLLPDILVETGVLDEKEFENVRANAHASLKELNAITAFAGGTDRGLTTIHLEFRPDQYDRSGRPADAITEHHLPYDFALLMDSENTAGENLTSFQAYLDQASTAVHLQLFTPLQGPLFSQEDNQILNLVRNAGRNRYGGAGVARVVYPHDAVLEFAALNWATAGLEEEWLRLDRDFDRFWRDYERDLAAGVMRKEPVLSELYVSFLEQYATAERPEPFFQQAFRSTRVLDDRQRPIAAKSMRFLEAVEVEVGRVIAADDELAELAEQSRLDPDRVADRDRAEREVIETEDALYVYEQAVREKIQEFKLFLVNQIILSDADVQGSAGGQAYRLNTWMLQSPDPLHPVAARAVLYEIRNALEAKLVELRAETTQLDQSLQRYKTTYDLDETEDVEEDAIHRVRDSLNQPLHRRIMGDAFKIIRDEYLEKAPRQNRSIGRFMRLKLLELVFDGVLRGIDGFLADWERFFRNLRQTRNHLLQEKNARARAHDETRDPTVQFVLARAEIKDRLWDDLRVGLVGRSLPADIAREIYVGHYARFADRERGGAVVEEAPERTEQLYRQWVLAWCRRQLRDLGTLDYDVLQALHKEAELLGLAPRDHVTDRVGRADHLARPLVPLVPDRAELQYWGVHEEVIEAMPGLRREELFGPHLISDAAFPRTEIVRYKAHYGLKVEDFPKFAAPREETGTRIGEYYKAYRDRVQRLEQGLADVTPHLDRKWHLPAYLPDLDPEENDERRDEADRAWVLGLAHGFLIRTKFDERLEWFHHRADGQSRAIMVDGHSVLGVPSQLYASLAYNPSVVDDVIRDADTIAERDTAAHPSRPEAHAFVQGCTETPATGTPLIDPVLEFVPPGQSSREIEEEKERLLLTLFDEVERYCGGVVFPGLRRRAQLLAARIISDMASQSEPYQTLRHAGGSRYVRILEERVRNLGGAPISPPASEATEDTNPTRDGADPDAH